MRTGLTLAALLLVVAGLWWAAASSGDPSTNEHDPTPPASAPQPAPTAPTQPEPLVAKPAPPPPAAVPPTAPTAEAPPSQPEPQPTANPTQDVQPVPPPERSGPVEELQRLFSTEPRDSGATPLESRVQTAFRDPAVPPGLLAGVLCRKSVCKIEVRWREEHNTAYMLALTSLLNDFSPETAFAPGPPDARGVTPIDVYWRRKTDTAP